MTNEKMLEELVELLKQETNWVKNCPALTNGMYSTEKKGVLFNVYMGIGGSYSLLVRGSDTNASFNGEPVRELYNALVERYGEVNVNAHNEKCQVDTLKLALGKLKEE